LIYIYIETKKNFISKGAEYGCSLFRLKVAKAEMVILGITPPRFDCINAGRSQQKGLSQISVFGKYVTSVICWWKNQVIQQSRDAVIIVNIFAHLRRIPMLLKKA
jgi:hypothetical protein